MPRQEAILPRNTVLELKRLLRDSAETDQAVQIRFAAAQATFAFNGIEFITKLIEGRFPDYGRVIPKGNRNTLTLGRTPLLAGLQRAALLTSEKFRAVRLHLAPGALRIASSNDMVKLEMQDAHSSVLFSFSERAGFQYVVSPMCL